MSRTYTNTVGTESSSQSFYSDTSTWTNGTMYYSGNITITTTEVQREYLRKVYGLQFEKKKIRNWKKEIEND